MKTKLLLSLFFVYAGAALAQESFKSSQPCEFMQAKTILMHAPGDELFLGVMHPNAALFDVYFDVDLARKEHQAYQDSLRQRGIRVITLTKALLKGCVDGDGKAIEGDALNELRQLASKRLSYDLSHVAADIRDGQLAQKQQIIAQASPRDLIRMILLAPQVTLYPTDNNTGLRAEYSEDPIMNLYFMRDQSITTARGTILCKMNSPQRALEVEILKLCYQRLAIRPLWQTNGDAAYLEGGDFIPFGNKAFIGTGMRTTQAAVDSMLTRDLFGCDSVIVVKDQLHYQPQMHLDTHFNIIDRDLCTMTEERILAPRGDKRRPLADIYIKNRRGHYELKKHDLDFADYITQVERMKIIPISAADQETYANNFLTISRREIMAVAGQSQKLRDTFRRYGVRVHWIPLTNLTRGFGAAHCMTQVIERK